MGVAVRTLRAVGIDNISLDLIFALPGELRRDWSRDLDLACSLLPAHLSLYGLTVEDRTPLARWISRGATSAPDDDRYADEYLFAHTRLAAQGYRFYEVSNACRDGVHLRHSFAYCSLRAYSGPRPPAHSHRCLRPDRGTCGDSDFIQAVRPVDLGRHDPQRHDRPGSEGLPVPPPNLRGSHSRRPGAPRLRGLAHAPVAGAAVGVGPDP